MTKPVDGKTEYVQALYKYPPLSTAEEHELAAKIAQGDEAALGRLVTHNLPFVVHMVSRMSAWRHGKLPMDDLIAIGNECLLRAARKWRPVGNVGFSAYARPWIERGVRRELDNTANIIRLPVNVLQSIRRMAYNERALTQILGRKPTSDELAKVLQVTPARIAQLQGYVTREPISLDMINNEKQSEGEEE
jgi:RNA polymerase primary sigma factor